MKILLLPIGIQGIAMFVDEFYFHHKRGLPLWEKIGHPIDTFSVFLCYLFLLLNPATETNMKYYIGLCLFSCLLITKDEHVHTKLCDSGEHWVHSLLFILHPITFFASGVLWVQKGYTDYFFIQASVIFSYMLYQIIYWSLWSYYGKNK